MRRWPVVSYAPHGWNWSFGIVSAVAGDHVAPWSKLWLTITSELVLALYGSAGAGRVLLRMSAHTAARCAPLVGSAARLNWSPLRKTESWYVCRPKANG